MRALSKKFLDDLKNPQGILYPILERKTQDDTLMLAIRNNYINIYYRGGNIINIKELSTSRYKASFDEQYNKGGKALPPLPPVIASQHEANQWVSQIPNLKVVMDRFFSKHPKPEREFQQLVARENNYSTISNETEYFVTDIEINDSAINARFDMLAVHWPAKQRGDRSSCRAALIEMKYGDNALAGDAGILKHLKDIESFMSDRKRYNALLATMESQFNQLKQLGLLRFNAAKNAEDVKLKAAEKPEVIFILANHNPRSTKLKKMLTQPAIMKYSQSNFFDLKFFIAAFSGYGMHADNMYSLDDFIKLSPNC